MRQPLLRIGLRVRARLRQRRPGRAALLDRQQVLFDQHIRMLSVPVDLPSVQVKQHWHERCHADAPNRWLRQTISGLFT